MAMTSATLKYGATAAALILGWRLWTYRSKKRSASFILSRHGVSLTGKRVLITGACSGIGAELALRMLECSEVNEVLLHGRSEGRVKEIISSLPEQISARCVPVVADLADLRAVRTLAESLRATPPDVVVCCAGVATLPAKTLTKDGYESQFAINHLSHFLLVTTLLPCLPSAARVVMVSSDIHTFRSNTLDLKNLNSQLSYSWFGAYLASKYCNVLFAQELHSRGVFAVSCTPGATDTSIDRYLSPALRFCFRYIGPGLVSKTVAQGCATVAYCASAAVVSGCFYDSECVLQDVKGDKVQKELWQESQSLVDAALL